MAWEKNSADQWIYKNADGSTMQDGYAKDSQGMAEVKGGVFTGKYADEIDNSNNLSVYDPTEDIQAMAKAQKKAALASLSKAYNQNVSDLNSAREKIEPTYYAKRNDVSTDSQIAAKNFAEYMASRGMVNSGTGVQNEIASNVALQGNLGGLAKQQAADYTENDRNLTNLSSAYNSDKASTSAGIDASAMQSLISAQQQYNAAKLAQANADRAYNSDEYWKNVDATGYLKNGTQTLTGQTTQLANDYQKLVNAGYPELQALEIAQKKAQIANTNKSTASMGASSGGGGVSKESAISAAQSWVYGMVYGGHTPTQAISALTSQKGPILKGLTAAGMDGDKALAYWQSLYADLNGN